MLNAPSLFLALAFMAASHATLAGFLVPQLPRAALHSSPVHIMRQTISVERLRAVGDPPRQLSHASPTV
jgi:hypothetical protein